MAWMEPIVGIQIANEVIPLNIRKDATDASGGVSVVCMCLRQRNMFNVPCHQFLVGESVCHKEMVCINTLIKHALMALMQDIRIFFVIWSYDGYFHLYE